MQIVVCENIEEFCEKSPPKELLHIYNVINNKIIPLLHSEGIPVTADECRKIFKQWFIEQRLPTKIT